MVDTVDTVDSLKIIRFALEILAAETLTFHPYDELVGFQCPRIPLLYLFNDP